MKHPELPITDAITKDVIRMLAFFMMALFLVSSFEGQYVVVVERSTVPLGVCVVVVVEELVVDGVVSTTVGGVVSTTVGGVVSTTGGVAVVLESSRLYSKQPDVPMTDAITKDVIRMLVLFMMTRFPRFEFRP
ncbi:MAG TPA: hypothetical protein VMA09_08375 [Candidatus Binataceae bacterium]|nr:hypothetical protein [Candidatus Binataceae bacterium]